MLSTLMMATMILTGTACAGGNGELPFGTPGDVIRTEVHNITLEKVVDGIPVPWGMAFLPDGSMLVTERAGDLRLVRDGNLHPEPVGGVPEVYARGQGGLLDIELHPDYDNNGWIYISYSYPGQGGGHTALMRARFDAAAHSLTDQEVLFRGQPLTTGRVHFGSRIRFDAKGYVYLAIGDRGEMQNAQNLGNHSGKLLRLHDDGRVPSDNPFVNTPGAMPEIYTYGNRNIQGMDIHPETGEVWTHEHGPRGGDELNVMRAGNNYGWPEISFGINYNGTIITDDTARAGMEQPVLHWTPSIAPSGMAFVTGDRYPNWKGNVMVGALAHQHVNRVVLDGERAVHTERMFEQVGRVREVKMGPDGYLYIGVENRGIFRLVPAD